MLFIRLKLMSFVNDKEFKQKEIEKAINHIQILGDSLDDKMSYYRETKHKLNNLIESYYPNDVPISLTNKIYVKLSSIEREIKRIEKQLIKARDKRSLLSKEYYIKYTDPNNKHVKFICTNFITSRTDYKCKHSFPANMYKGPVSNNREKYNSPYNERTPMKVIGVEYLYNTAPDNFVDFIMSADTIRF